MMKWFFKKSTKEQILIIIMAVLVVLLVILAVVMIVGAGKRKKVQDQSMPEIMAEHPLYLDYGTDFRYTYSMEYPKSTSEDGRTVFEVPEGETVVFTIVPIEGKILKDVSVKAGTEKIKFKRTDNDISFVMPRQSVSVSPVMAVDTSYATPTPGPAEVTVEGVTDELAAIMLGQYNEKLFLNNLRTALSLDNANSSYRDVTVISFTGEMVDTGIANTVGMVALLNHTTTRKILVLYNTSSDVYSFTLNYVPTVAAVSARGSPTPTQTPKRTPSPTPTPKPTSTPVPAATKAAEVPSGSSGNITGDGGNTGGGYEVPYQEEPEVQDIPVTEEEFISRFTLYEYPESFSSYVGGSEVFLNALYDYIYGMDPDITSGTFEGFAIEGNLIKFTVSLSNGGMLVGTYDRDAGEFYF